MVQLPIEAQTPPHPVRALYSGGYVEGWAIFAEALAIERGLFDGDPAGELGALHWLLFRALRARIDIALHADGWSVQRALDRWRRAMGRPIYLVDFDADTASHAHHPGLPLAEASYCPRFEAIPSRALPLARSLT